MKHTLIALVLIVETLLPAVSQSQGLLSDSIVKALKMGVKGFKDRYHSPSIVVAIVHGNQVIFSDAQGYIDLAKKIPATLNSVYPIQSVTKMFTATMFMQLAERTLAALTGSVLN